MAYTQSNRLLAVNTPLGKDVLLLTAFSGEEAMSRLFVYQLDMLSENKALAAKDISQGGIVGTAMMLAECSGVGAIIDVTTIPRPDGVVPERWLQTFPSYGYILAVAPAQAEAVRKRFAVRGIAAAEIGDITACGRVTITDGHSSEAVWDFAREPLIGCGAVPPQKAEAPA